MDTLPLQIALGTRLTGPQGAFQNMESPVRGSSRKALAGVTQGAGDGGVAGSAEVAFRPGAASPWPASPAGTHSLECRSCLQEGGGPGTPLGTQDAMSCMKWARSWLREDRAPWPERGTGGGAEKGSSRPLCLSRADSEPFPLGSVCGGGGTEDRGRRLLASSIQLPATRACPVRPGTGEW